MVIVQLVLWLVWVYKAAEIPRPKLTKGGDDKVVIAVGVEAKC